MSERRYLNVYNINGDFMFGLYNRYGDFMTDVAKTKLMLFKAMSECSPDCTQLEALAYLMASGFEVYVSTDTEWYRSEAEQKALTEMFSENCGGHEVLYTVDKDMDAMASEYSYTIGEEFRTIDLIWEESWPQDFDEIDEAVEMPQEFLDVVTEKNVDTLMILLSPSVKFYKYDGLYYNMD